MPSRICEAGFANLWLHDGEDSKAAAIYGAPPEFGTCFETRSKSYPASARLLPG